MSYADDRDPMDFDYDAYYGYDDHEFDNEEHDEEDDELSDFTCSDDGEGDFDTSGRAPDINPYGDPDY